MSNNAGITIFNKKIFLTPEKIKTNKIRLCFAKISNNWKEELRNNFYTRFSDLDEFYDEINNFISDIISDSINESMRILTAHEIYDICGEDFRKEYIENQDLGEGNIEAVLYQYEEIIEKTSNLDEHRTRRRQNRGKWVGFGTMKNAQTNAHTAAASRNLFEGILHGAFNLAAKGVTAVGDAFAKDKIFKSPSTFQAVLNSVEKIAIAALNGTVAIINERNPGSLYYYSDDEMSKVNSIIDNVEKNRVPAVMVSELLVKAINLHPYNQNIYRACLLHLGSDNGRLDDIVKYFGMENLFSLKKCLIQSRLQDYKSDSIDSLVVDKEELNNYAKQISYSDFDVDYQHHFDELKMSLARNLYDNKSSAIPSNKVRLEETGVNTPKNKSTSREIIDLMSRIVVHRQKVLVQDITATYIVLIDGVEFCRLKNGEGKEISIPSGKHKIQIKHCLDWRRSPEVEINSKESERIEFECGPNGNLLLAGYRSVFSSKNCFYLRRL